MYNYTRQQFIYNIKNGVGIMNTHKGFKFTCIHGLREPYSKDPQSQETLECIANIAFRLKNERIYYYYYPPYSMKYGNIYERNPRRCPWALYWNFENKNTDMFQNTVPYYITNNPTEYGTKKYINKMPCFDFPDY